MTHRPEVDPAAEADIYCDVCGHDPDCCTCPECPVCCITGDPSCYENHGLVVPAMGPLFTDGLSFIRFSIDEDVYLDLRLDDDRAERR